MKKAALLSDMISRGDVYYNIKGTTPAEILASLVKVVRVPKAIDKKKLTEALIERESIATTSVGEAIAIPHPRHHMIVEEKDSFVAVAYLEDPSDWHANDGMPVSTLFLVMSADAENHLSVLSAIACLAGKDGFQKTLARKPSKKELVAYVDSTNC